MDIENIISLILAVLSFLKIDGLSILEFLKKTLWLESLSRNIKKNIFADIV